jgi:hypothetical protein
MLEIEPLHTQVKKTIQAMVGIIVLEEPGGFPVNESNLYCLGKNGEIVWKADKPEPAGLYNRVMLNTDGNTLSAYAITGQACEIDLLNGNLISQVKIV